MLHLDGSALAYRRDEGRVELVQPCSWLPMGAATGVASGGVLGMRLLEPVLRLRRCRSRRGHANAASAH